MMIRNSLLVIAVLAPVTRAAAQSPGHGREVYLERARAAYRTSAERCPAQVQQWIESSKSHVLFGYAPPAGPVWLAALAGSLYELTGEEPYARAAAKWLAEQHRFKQHFPEALRAQRVEYKDGLPTLTDFFHLAAFAQAYLRIRDSGAVTPEQRAQIEQSIADSADFMLVFPEWGPMNRAILRAEGLALAARALPQHPQAETWRKLARVLARDSWAHWGIEDASIYQPVWLLSLIHYADIVADPSLFSQHTARYYFDYFLHLLSPAGTVPEFGDARWNESWPSYLACLERAASEYRRGDLKWGALRIFEAMTAESGDNIGARTALILTDAYRWADDSLTPVQPISRSEEVLDDVIGKKIIFRNGWDRDATYLMLNYRDEGPFALVPRDFLRHTITVEEEKMHHGHSDENAICLLMHEGAVLLHDSGYRDALPSGPYGAFRADYFHNRLVGRKNRRGREQPLLEFLRHSGAYHPTRTQKIDFFTFPDAEMSRTRVEDERTGFASDRVIVYLKCENIFVVFDIVKILRADYYTFSTLWHATTVLEQGPQHYLTAIESIGKYRPPQTQGLLIDFIQGGVRTHGTFPLRCHWQDEVTIYQTTSSHYRAGGIETFVTALVPHRRGTDVQPTLQAIRLLDVDPPRAGVGVQLELGDDLQFVCVKTDLAMDVLTENARPRYTFDSGRVSYGPFETDASFLYARQSGDKLAYAAANMVRILHKGNVIFSARPNTFTLQPDALSTSKYGLSKWRCW